MAPTVHWMGKASGKVNEALVPLFTKELKTVFPRARVITVYDCFRGYSSDQERKVVLAVEVRSTGDYHTHVVKLGTGRAVAKDYSGWRRCVAKHHFASRILVSVARKKLAKNRQAVIYEDAYTLLGPDPAADTAVSLEKAASWAIQDDGPDPRSVERVIRQIYREMAVWFYRDSRADAAEAAAFYRRRLKRAKSHWKSRRPWIDLRRELIWLFCGRDKPDGAEPAEYLDPYDYVFWALEQGRVPETLVGRSHGDLHARNVLVGVQRGEVEFPAVFDYGEMDTNNVLVWDFVKLETELKTRLLDPLYKDRRAAETLLSRYANRRNRTLPALPEGFSADQTAQSLRIRRLAFAFEFESLLAELTGDIGTLVDTDSLEPPRARDFTGNHKLDRALAILVRIRQEAALWLGDELPQRQQWSLWKDEYYFALAAYGLSTAKFVYKEFQTEFALVSAGVAASQIDSARKEIERQITRKTTRLPGGDKQWEHPYPCYQIPLAHAHRLWKRRKNIAVAMKLMADAAPHFDHAVPLRQEYALILAEAGQHDQALELVEPLRDLCKVFSDDETLARIGRVWKDRGDRALENFPVSVSEMGDGAAKQWYQTAYEVYAEAFEIRKNYYPGVNAATLALLQGNDNQAQKLAKEVLTICDARGLGGLGQDEQFWMLASEGEASLLVRRGKQAARFYGEALAILHSDQPRMAQSAYGQVCRLCWVLHGLGDQKTIRPVLGVFRQSPFELKPGPMKKCGLDKRAVGCATA